MCSEGKHPPETWGHLTHVEFVMRNDHWTAFIQADDMPDKSFVLYEAWMDGNSPVEPEGVRWLNRRLFGD